MEIIKRAISAVRKVAWLVIFLGGISESFSKTLNIKDFGAKDGNVVVAINSAIDAARSGDTVFIGKGIWEIKGEAIRAKSGITIKGAGITETILKHTSATIEHPFFLIEAVSGLTISDLTLDGGLNSQCTHGIDGGDVNDVLVSRVRIQNLVESSEFGTFGVFFNGNARNCSIESCVFENIGTRSKWGAAVQVSQLPSVPASDTIRVTNNFIHNTGRGGILMQNTTSAIVRNNVIKGTGKSGDDGLAIELFDGCDFGVIENNIVDHWISVDGGSYVAIRNNLVKDNPAEGLQFAGIEVAGASANCVVSGNRVESGCHVGVSVSNDGEKQNFLFANNIVKSTETFGAQIQGDNGGAKRLYFYKNDFESIKKSGRSFAGDAGHGFRVNGNVQQLVLDGNTFRLNQGNGIQIRTDDYISLPVDHLSFKNNLFESNLEAVDIDSELFMHMKKIYWADSNKFYDNTSTKQLPSKGQSQSIGLDASIVLLNNGSAKVGDRVMLSIENKGYRKITQILWDLGIGKPSTEKLPVVSYEKPGTYSIRMVAWDDTGEAAIDEVDIVIE